MNADFSDLFTKPREWEHVIREISSFGLNAYYAAKGPDRETRDIQQFLSSRRIALNVALDALPTENCGEDVEGMVRSPEQPGAVAARLRKLGVQVKYFSFDEPLTFGHLYQGKNACKYTVREVAKRLARSIFAIRRSYPMAVFVDYEVPNGSDMDELRWRKVLKSWLIAYKRETGETLRFLILDVQWHLPWKNTVASTIEMLHTHGTKAGLFINAEGNDSTSDASWISEAKTHIADVEREKISADVYVFATWTRHPWNMLPESDPQTLTSLLRWYGETYY